jgi:hypothetical protein
LPLDLNLESALWCLNRSSKLWLLACSLGVKDDSPVSAQFRGMGSLSLGWLRIITCEVFTLLDGMATTSHTSFQLRKLLYMPIMKLSMSESFGGLRRCYLVFWSSRKQLLKTLKKCFSRNELLIYIDKAPMASFRLAYYFF